MRGNPLCHLVSPLVTSPKPVYPRVCGGTPLHTEQVQWLSVAESAWEVVMGMREVSSLPALLVDQGLDFREAQPDFSVDLSDAGLGSVLHVGSPKRLVTKPL